MTQRDVDDLIREWTDLGEERLPDRYLTAALQEIESTPQSGGRPLPLEGLIMRFQSTARYLAVAAAAVAAVVLYVAVAGLPVGDQDPSPTPPTASPDSTTTPSQPVIPSPVAVQGHFEIDTPSGSLPLRAWQFDRRDDSRLPEGLRGYVFFTDVALTRFAVEIYLDPEADYAGTLDTTRDDLVVSIDYLVGADDPADWIVGRFESTSGECRVTFDEFSDTVASGSLDCSDIPGTYGSSETTPSEGFVQLLGTFAFRP